MAIVMPKLVQDFLKQLPLRWEVIIESGKGDMLTIMSELIDPVRKLGQHRIFAPPSYLARPKYYQVDWAHELCHAVLAERIDMIFGGSPAVGDIEPKERDRRARILFYARLHDDLFVNDAREELLGHKLTVEDVRSAYQSFLGLVKYAKINRGQSLSILQDPRIPWQLALNIAEDERHNCRIGAIRVLDFLASDSCQKIEAICSIYRDLPRLSWKPEVDLSVFEKSVQRVVAEIFQENWQPRMINYPDFPSRKVWSVA